VGSLDEARGRRARVRTHAFAAYNRPQADKPWVQFGFPP